MDDLQTEKKPFARRYKWFIVAFVAGFIPGAALAGVMTGADLWSKSETSELIMVLHTAQSAAIGGLLSGVCIQNNFSL